MKVCTWTESKVNERQNYYCMELTGHKEITLFNNFECPHTSSCSDSAYIRVENVTSLYRCTGKCYTV